MSLPSLDHLQVLVTGVDAGIAGDVVRLVVAEGARVTAADRDGGRLAALHRDLGLGRNRMRAEGVDLASEIQVRIWAGELRQSGRSPQLMICCCGAPAGTRGRHRDPSDVTLSEARPADCPALAAARILGPVLFLHARPLRRSVFDRALAVLRHPTLRGVLARAPGRAAADALISYVRLAPRLHPLHRPESAGAHLRLTPDPAQNRADAA
jgi:NAD(P)-dependent dehydrogenase (short-subunit alcohol dehydrogenase family)